MRGSKRRGGGSGGSGPPPSPLEYFNLLNSHRNWDKVPDIDLRFHSQLQFYSSGEQSIPRTLTYPHPEKNFWIVVNMQFYFFGFNFSEYCFSEFAYMMGSSKSRSSYVVRCFCIWSVNGTSQKFFSLAHWAMQIKLKHLIWKPNGTQS